MDHYIKSGYLWDINEIILEFPLFDKFILKLNAIYTGRDIDGLAAT